MEMMCEVVAIVDFWLGHVIKRFVASVLTRRRANAEVVSEILAGSQLGQCREKFCGV
jgi:hypothetical protein